MVAETPTVPIWVRREGGVAWHLTDDDVDRSCPEVEARCGRVLGGNGRRYDWKLGTPGKDWNGRLCNRCTGLF
jgi:hypothetical protein